MNTMTPSSGPRGLIATAILGALASSVSAVSAADAGTEPVSLTVKFADLNVSQPRGAAVLYGRINAAPKTLARSIGSSRTRMRSVACTMPSQTRS